MTKRLKKFLIDRCFAQAYEEAGVTREEFSDACEKLSLQPHITSPTGIKEYSDAKIFRTSNSLGSETWNVIESDGSKTYTEGEDEAIAIAQTESEALVGTFDKTAIKKCKKIGINYIDHITFLLSMVKIGTIDITKADSIYRNWGTNIPPNSPQTLTDYIKQNK